MPSVLGWIGFAVTVNSIAFIRINSNFSYDPRRNVARHDSPSHVFRNCYGPLVFILVKTAT